MRASAQLMRRSERKVPSKLEIPRLFRFEFIINSRGIRHNGGEMVRGLHLARALSRIVDCAKVENAAAGVSGILCIGNASKS